MLETVHTGSRKTVFENGKQWQGRMVAGKFPLRHYIGSSDRSAVFSTELAGDKTRRAVIKLITGDAAEKDIQLGRLRLAARITHPHLLQIFEVGSCQLDADDLLFVVMEQADETLSQILPERPLSGSEAREMLKPLLETLTYIHDNGFAHGHLKPSNIMVVGEQLKLSSDGLCKPGVAVASRRGASLYEAPEASRDGFSPAGDAWSLGVTLTHALTQRLPVWNDRLREEPWLPSPLPEPFSQIASHCMRRDPSSRWTISQITGSLEQPAKAQRQTKSKSAECTGRTKRDISTWIYAGGMVAVIAIAILFASLTRHRPATRADAAPPTATTAKKLSPNPQRLRTNRSSPNVQQQSFPTGKVIRQVVPDIPQRALRTIHGKVRVAVRVHLDAAGNVVGAEFASAGPSRYFANHAMAAAQSWKFAQGRDATRVWLLQFIFERTGTSVQPRELAS
ncbi:MAG TPA: protein kinase [Terriglobales bacterium]|nr:protein kinase [Terriglobales bacterium]